MTNRSLPRSTQTQPVHACCDTCAPNHEDAVVSVSERDLVKRQTGSVLIALGAMFSGSPIFREHVDESTANMLVSLGRKLKK